MTQDDCVDYYEEYLGSDERGCCLLCPDAEPGCLCYDCKCTKCYWYDSDDIDGHCELADQLKEEREECGNSYSDIKVRNIIKETSKAVFGQIGNSELIWIPRSVINNNGYVKNWFLERET